MFGYNLLSIAVFADYEGIGPLSIATGYTSRYSR